MEQQHPPKLDATTEYSTRFRASRKKFETIAGGLQPSPTGIGAHRDPVLVALRKKVQTAYAGTDLEHAILLCEKLLPEANQSSEDLTDFINAVQAVFKEVYDYNTAVTNAIASPAIPLNQQTVAKYIAGAKVLSTETKKIHLDLKQEVTKAKYQGVADSQTTSSYAKQAAQNIALAKAAAVKAQNFIKQARGKKVSDQAKFFNDGVQTAARDITTQIGTLDKLAKQGYKFDRAQPAELFATLKAWANDGRRIGIKGGQATFDEEIGEFEHAVTAVANWAK